MTAAVTADIYAVGVSPLMRDSTEKPSFKAKLSLPLAHHFAGADCSLAIESLYTGSL